MNLIYVIVRVAVVYAYRITADLLLIHSERVVVILLGYFRTRDSELGVCQRLSALSGIA